MKKRLTTALAVLLVPLLVAGAFLWGTWNADPRLRQVEAAVVNNDKMVTINGQPMPLGRQLAAELVNSERDQNFTWVLADNERALAGLQSGRYAAVVTIPEDFSANATSFSGSPDTVKQAEIAVRTSPVTGISETALGQSIADASANALNRFLTKEYLKNIYLGFNQMGEQFVTLRDGTAQLADGAHKLADGTDQAAAGAAQLSDGLGQLAANSGRLVSGAEQAASGAGQYVDGVGKLAGGLDQLSGGLHKYADGVEEYAAGSHTYAKGVRDYSQGVSQYTDGVGQLVRPIRDLVAKLVEFVDGLPEFSGWLVELERLADLLPDRLIEFDAQVQAFTARVAEFLTQLGDADDQASALRRNVNEASAVASRLASGKQTVPCPESLASVEGGCEAFAEGVRRGAGVTSDNLKPLLGDAKELDQLLAAVVKNREKLLAANEQVAEASARMAAYAPQLRKDITTLRGQIPEDFPKSKSELQSAVKTILGQLDMLLDAGDKLSDGGAGLAAGAAQLANGADKLAGGADQLAGGARDASTGAKTLATEGRRLVGGLKELASGLKQYAGGVKQASDGSVKAADGFAALAVGARQLADGVQALADGVAEGASQIPSYNPEQRQNLANVVAEPVSTEGLSGLVAPTVSWASLLFVAALWLGGLAMWIARKALDSRNVTSTATNGRLLWRSLAPGLGIVGLQALLMTVVGAVIIKPPPLVGLGIAGVLLLAAVAFVVVNHALAAWGGQIGRLLSLTFLVITGVSALAYSSPGIFQALRPLSPVTPALDAVRAVMTGFSPVVPSLMLVGWIIVGLAASGAAIVRSRTVRLKDLALA